MGNNTWNTNVSRVGKSSPQKSVITYYAIVGTNFEKSSFTWNRSIAHEKCVNALLTAPHWSLRAWPDTSTLQAETLTERELIHYALAKLKALFDFASGLPDGTAHEIQTALVQQFPGAKMKATRIYRRFAIDAEVLENGDAIWGYTNLSNEALYPGIRDEKDLDQFIQNVVRADIQQQIEKYEQGL